MLSGDATTGTVSVLSTKLFADCALPMPPGPPPLWGPGGVPGQWADVCGFLKLRGSDGQWNVRQAHSPFPTKLLVSARLTRVAIRRLGSTLTVSNGAANSHTVRNTIGGTHQRWDERLFAVVVASFAFCRLEQQMVPSSVLQTGTFASRNGQRALEIELQNVTSPKY